METEVAVITEEEKLKQLALSDLARAQAIQVVDNESYRDCCMMEMQLKDGIKFAETKMEPVLESTRTAWKAALKLLSDVISPRNEALALVQEKRVGFENRQREKAELEQKRKADAALEKAKQDAEQTAVFLEQAGETDLAAQVRGSVSAPFVNVEPDIPKVKGIATVKKWLYKVVDPGKVSKAYLIPDDKKIQGIVTSQHKDAEQIVGGIEVYSKDVPRGAAKK